MAQSSRTISGKPFRVEWMLLSPALAVYGIIFLLPALLLVVISFQVNAPEQQLWERDFSLANYERFFTDPYFLKVIGKTLVYCIVVVAATLVVGYLLAYYIYKAKSYAKTTLITLVLTPLFSGALLQSLGWYLLFARYGPINAGLRALGWLDKPFNFLGTDGAVMIALVHAFLPFMVLSILNSLRTIPANLSDAAASLGAGPWSTFLRVTLPLTKGGMIAGSTLVIGLTIGSFATPGIVGQGKIQLLAQIIYQQAIQVFDWPFAAVISLMLLAILGVISALPVLLTRKSRGALQ
ncbi:MAG TPA: ABC transporter permease [Paenibacillaceae bacterium]